ncbi:hypothetical protein LJC45_03800 [Alistipes sp. OttesenSCG-928-B03]|nr:hypothetical protein [Alistipes sp. OttesenSCG-928-B03]
MKKRISLLDEFRRKLQERIPSRPELVKEVARILNVEKEPVSRRLNGNVSFSVDETGRLAKAMGISLDSILTDGDKYKWTRYALEKPWSEGSLSPMAEMVEQFLDRYEEIGVEGSEFGFLFTTLPMNLMIHYPNLSKFVLFKWGYYYIGYDEFNDYDGFETPERFVRIRERFAERRFDGAKIINIWDEALVWILCREIQSFHAMHLIGREHVGQLKDELHAMLTGLETFIRKEADDPQSGLDISFYISNVHIGVNSWYHISDKACMSHLFSNFARTSISYNRESSLNMRDWIGSLRKISSLISGTGHRERRMFFESQHKIVDLLLSPANL